MYRQKLCNVGGGVQARREGLAAKREAHRERVLERRRNLQSVQTPKSKPTSEQKGQSLNTSRPQVRETPDQRKIRLQKFRELKLQLSEQKKFDRKCNTPAFKVGIAPVKTSETVVKTRRVLTFETKNPPPNLRPTVPKTPAIRTALAARALRTKTPQSSGVAKDDRAKRAIPPETGPAENPTKKQEVPRQTKVETLKTVVHRPVNNLSVPKHPSTPLAVKKIEPTATEQTPAMRQTLRRRCQPRVLSLSTQPSTQTKKTPLKNLKTLSTNTRGITDLPNKTAAASRTPQTKRTAQVVQKPKQPSRTPLKVGTLEENLPKLRRKVLAQKNLIGTPAKVDLNETDVSSIDDKEKNLLTWNTLMAKIKGGPQ